jgi:predicted nucleotidyltransferase
MKILNSSQTKIIREIIRTPGINLRGVIEKTKLSPNFVSEYVNLLVERGILKEEKLEKKRVYLRRFYFNLKSDLGKNIFSLVKEEEKDEFFKKYKKLKPIFQQFVEEIKTDFILVYGSYARLAAEKDSDLDLLIVGNIKNREKIREILVSLDIEVSIKIETLKNFEKRIKDALHQQIIMDNILIYDSGKFVELLRK